MRPDNAPPRLVLTPAPYQLCFTGREAEALDLRRHGRSGALGRFLLCLARVGCFLLYLGSLESRLDPQPQAGA